MSDDSSERLKRFIKEHIHEIKRCTVQKTLHIMKHMFDEYIENYDPDI